METTAPKPASSEMRDKFIRWRFVLICMCLPPFLAIVDTLAVVAYVQPGPSIKSIGSSDMGKIFWPVDGAKVDFPQPVEGIMEPSPEGYSVWIVTDKGGKIWPKNNLGSKGGYFKLKYMETSRKYHMRVVRVPVATSDAWTAWREENKVTKKWKPVEMPEDYVDILRLKLYQ